MTAVVVALAIASAILSAGRPKSPQTEALWTPSAMPSPSTTRTFTSTPTPSPTSTPIATRTPTPNPTFRSYVVQAGETLSAIAGRFGVTIQAILAANPSITDPAHIVAGQHILIPPRGWTPSPSPS
jgi:LysM repeat protein